MEDLKQPKDKLVSQQRDIPTVQLMQGEDNGDDSTNPVINKYNEVQNEEYK